MPDAHHVDSTGLSLPDAGWPPDRVAPGDLEALRRFINTTNLESGAERWRDVHDVRSWLAAEGHQAWDVTDRDIAVMIEFRELLRDLATANHNGDFAAPDRSDLLAGVRLGVARDGARLTVVSSSTGVDGMLGHMAAIAVRAGADGTWRGLKACRNDRCRWAYYDHSKNQRGRWCSMTACGSRQKARAYRARNRTG